MTAEAQPVTGSALRRRGAELERTILDAAWAELLAVGYPALTIEGVARRARTGKAVIYRRWPDQTELLLDALRHHIADRDELPDTGELRADLLILCRQVATRFGAVPRGILTGLMTETAQRPELHARLRAHVETSGLSDRLQTILSRAAGRGEVDLGRVTPRIRTLPLDLLRHEYLVQGGEIADEVITEVVDDIYLPLLRAR